MAEAILTREYYDIGSPAAFSSVERLYRRVKGFGVKKKQVKEWLMRQDAYTLHRRATRRLKAEPRVYVKGIDRQWAIDLCDMRSLVAVNNGFRYILTCIDVFSKYAWAAPVRVKSAEQVSNAFREILSSTTRRPARIESDKGSEFHNAKFKKLLQSYNIYSHFSTNSRHKSATVERFNRTLKSLLYKAFTAVGHTVWTNLLEPALKTYNNRLHRSIGMWPSKVDHRNEKIVYETLYKRKPKRGQRLPFNQLVRISKVKRVFDKGYLPNYTTEVFRIAHVHDKRNPIQYTLEDLAGERLQGRFVAEELSPVKKTNADLWRVERVIKRSDSGRYLVQWEGFPAKFNSWVDSVETI